MFLLFCFLHINKCNSDKISYQIEHFKRWPLRNYGILVPVRTSLVCASVAVKRTMYQRKVDVDMLNAVKSVLADVSSVSPSSEQKEVEELG